MAVVCLRAIPAVAQTAVAPLPTAFVGLAFGPTTSDAPNRMRLYRDDPATVWAVEAGAALGDRVGIGVEFSQASAVKASTTIGAGRAQIAGRQEERVLLGMLRARIIGERRWAVDVLGGAGVLFQHHETGGCEPAVRECEVTNGPFLDERAPAFVAGVEIPVRLAGYFAVVPTVRGYFLRRGELTFITHPNLIWQYEWRSSSRVALALSGRLVW